MMGPFTCKLRDHPIQGRSLAELSQRHRLFRDWTGLTALEFPLGVVRDEAGEVVAMISFEGRVWEVGCREVTASASADDAAMRALWRERQAEHYAAGPTPPGCLYDPYAEVAPVSREAELIAALEAIQRLLKDWPTERALTALGSERATTKKREARAICAKALRCE